MRAIYRYERDAGRLTVKRVWTEHDAYEREIKRGWSHNLGPTVQWQLE